MRGKGLLLADEDRDAIERMHGIHAMSRNRPKFKIPVPQQGSTPSASHHGPYHQSFTFIDTLHDESSQTARKTGARRPGRNGTYTKSASRSPETGRSDLISVEIPVPHHAGEGKGKAPQVDLPPDLSRSTRSSVKARGTRKLMSSDIVIDVRSDDEEVPDQRLASTRQDDFASDWQRPKPPPPASKALQAKEQRRQREADPHRAQDSRHYPPDPNQRRPGPVPLEQPNEGRLRQMPRMISRQDSNLQPSSASRSFPSDQFPASAEAQTGTPTSLISRMKPKPSTSPSATSSTHVDDVEILSNTAPFHQSSAAAGPSTVSSSNSSTKTSKGPKSLGREGIPQSAKMQEVRLDGVAVSDIWRCDESADPFMLVKSETILIGCGPNNIKLELKWSDVADMEITMPDETNIGVLGLSLKDRSTSAKRVQAQFPNFDPRASGDASSLLLIIRREENALDTFSDLKPTLASKVDARRWLPGTATRTRIQVAMTIRSGPWPNEAAFSSKTIPLGGLDPPHNFSERQKRLRSDTLENLSVDFDAVGESSRRREKAFNLLSDRSEGSPTPTIKGTEDVNVSPTLSPVPSSPPLPSLKIRNNKASPPTSRIETRSHASQMTNEPVVQFPYEGIGAVTVLESDMKRLRDGELLNDTLIEFGLKFMHEEIRKRDPGLAESIYIFNTFFYKILSASKDMKTSYQKVRKWTSKVDLFSKKYIIVPINEELHWYLAFIVNPWYLLNVDVEPKEKTSGADLASTSVPTSRRTTRQTELNFSRTKQSEIESLTSKGKGQNGDSESYRGSDFLLKADTDAGVDTDPEAKLERKDHQPDQRDVSTPPLPSDHLSDIEMMPIPETTIENGASALQIDETTSEDRQAMEVERGFGDGLLQAQPVEASASQPSHNSLFFRPRPAPVPSQTSASSSRIISVQDTRKVASESTSGSDQSSAYDGWRRPLGLHYTSPSSSQKRSDKLPKHIVFDDDCEDHDRGASSSESSSRPVIEFDDGSTPHSQQLKVVDPPESEALDGSRTRLKKRRWDDVSSQFDVGRVRRSSSTEPCEDDEVVYLRKGRGTLEGGGGPASSQNISLSSSSPTSSRVRTKIVPGADRERSVEPVKPTAFYGQRAHQSTRKAAKQDDMDIDILPSSAKSNSTYADRDRKRSNSGSIHQTSSPSSSQQQQQPSQSESADRSNNFPWSRSGASLSNGRSRVVDYDLNQTFVITFDSLGSQHLAVRTKLREYLWREALDKHRLPSSKLDTESKSVNRSKAGGEGEQSGDDDGAETPPEASDAAPMVPLEHFPKLKCIRAQVPIQPNFCDCGIYLLHYFDRFFSDPDHFLDMIVESAATRASGGYAGNLRRREAEKEQESHWQAGTVSGKRKWWRETIRELSEGWKEFKEQKKAEKIRVKGELDMQRQQEAEGAHQQPEEHEERVAPASIIGEDPPVGEADRRRDEDGLYQAQDQYLHQSGSVNAQGSESRASPEHSGDQSRLTKTTSTPFAARAEENRWRATQTPSSSPPPRPPSRAHHRSRRSLMKEDDDAGGGSDSDSDSDSIEIVDSTCTRKDA